MILLLLPERQAFVPPPALREDKPYIMVERRWSDFLSTLAEVACGICFVTPTDHDAEERLMPRPWGPVPVLVVGPPVPLGSSTGPASGGLRRVSLDRTVAEAGRAWVDGVWPRYRWRVATAPDLSSTMKSALERVFDPLRCPRTVARLARDVRVDRSTLARHWSAWCGRGSEHRLEDVVHASTLVQALGLWLDGMSWELIGKTLGCHPRTLRSYLRGAGDILPNQPTLSGCLEVLHQIESHTLAPLFPPPSRQDRLTSRHSG